MTKQFTVKAFVSGKQSAGDGQTTLKFGADYADGCNKEWAKYTPYLDYTMVVLDKVAEGIEYDDKFDVVFTKSSGE